MRMPSSAAATRRCAAVPSRLRAGPSAAVSASGAGAGRSSSASRRPRERPRPRPPRRPRPPARECDVAWAASRARLVSASATRDESGSGRAWSRCPSSSAEFSTSGGAEPAGGPGSAPCRLCTEGRTAGVALTAVTTGSARPVSAAGRGSCASLRGRTAAGAAASAESPGRIGGGGSGASKGRARSVSMRRARVATAGGPIKRVSNASCSGAAT